MLHEEKENFVLTITCLEDEILLLNSELESIPEHVQVMNNNCEELDDVLDKNKKVVGFDYSFMRNKFVPLKKKTEFLMFNHMSSPLLDICTPNIEGSRTLQKDVTTMVNIVT